MSRKDVFRSFVRSAVGAVAEPLKRAAIPEELRHRLKDLLSLRAALSEQRLTAVACRVPGISAVTISVIDGRVRVDAVTCDGRPLVLSLIPIAATFAPRGAKEICFCVDPETAADDPRAADLVAAFCAEITRAIWGPLLPRGESGSYPPPVEREGNRLRVDLRSVPELRSALRQPGIALVVELYTAKAIIAEPGTLRVVLGIHSFDA